MKLKHRLLDNIAAKWLKKLDKVQALRQIEERVDWRVLAERCRAKISAEYKFWVVKAPCSLRTSKLADLTRDVAFMNTIENREAITADELRKLQQIKFKYGLA